MISVVRTQVKVFYPVVIRNSVAMMDYLRAKQGPSDEHLHDSSMCIETSATPKNANMALFCFPSTLPSRRQGTNPAFHELRLP